MAKFQPTQKVMILNLLANGTKQDVSGNIVRYMGAGSYKGHYQVDVNTALLYLKEDRLVDFEEYWRNKK